MQLLLQILLFGVLGVVVVSIVTLLALWRTLRRRLRVDPKVRSVAPTHWHLGQHKAARAHRRLRLASQSALQIVSVQSSKANRNVASEFPALAQSIVDRAVIAERELVSASKVPRADRFAALKAPLADVARIEATVAELVSTTTAWRNAIDQQRHDPLDEVHDRLTNLRHASEGVRSVETTRTMAPYPSSSPINENSRTVAPTPATQTSQSSVENYIVETE
jgi:hypothetical protein